MVPPTCHEEMRLGLLASHPPDLPLALQCMQMSRPIARFALVGKEYASSAQQCNIAFMRYNYFSIQQYTFVAQESSTCLGITAA